MTNTPSGNTLTSDLTYDNPAQAIGTYICKAFVDGVEAGTSPEAKAVASGKTGSISKNTSEIHALLFFRLPNHSCA